MVVWDNKDPSLRVEVDRHIVNNLIFNTIRVIFRFISFEELIMRRCLNAGVKDRLPSID